MRVPAKASQLSKILPPEIAGEPKSEQMKKFG